MSEGLGSSFWPQAASIGLMVCSIGVVFSKPKGDKRKMTKNELMCCIGSAPMGGQVRFDMGIVNLSSGINPSALMMGIFAARMIVMDHDKGLKAYVVPDLKAHGLGIIGMALVLLDIPLTPVLLSFILGPMIEKYVRRAYSYSKGDWSLFLTRPISAILLLVAVVVVLMPVIAGYQKATG